MTKAPRVRIPTAKDDEDIRRGIAADPDAAELPAEARVLKRRRGRPTGRTKTQVSIKLDDDVIAALKTPDAKGWQTRANATLRKGLGLKQEKTT
ncbi:uncharacterized protein (DUF4415 family) [Rhodobium orientis]|uniref:BrnA antitoxin family protein n=1 Tax=Rhodobium orientis TaxID=34017 RepID=A0A327JSY2_9HYPH|nr:BrnA antitoxin family protein [Rhodobium orientis]MBB4303043.1 uncharacterized protein (DUF4415 family) [Rhodobium orientis]MBK5949601.1 hypothetical protein [Rhodobium orientis]RAI29387.1 hypothetical protein CH339_03645 [Rhodobium orientis]